MTQSASRTPGRRSGPPPSFGRHDEEPQEDFVVRGGAAIHVVLHAEVIPDRASLEELRRAIRETTRAGVLDGYADAFAAMDSGDADQPGGGDGGAPPG